ncbi:MAG: threonine synthase [Zestosphaera sp.]
MKLFKTNVVLRCVKCGSIYDADPWLFTCPHCGSLLEVVMPEEASLSWPVGGCGRRYVWSYRELLPLSNDVEPVSLGEGGTPLIPLNRITQALKTRSNAYMKLEGTNPTGSFKDRGMTVGVTIARYTGVNGVVVASTGNTAASAAAYSARVGLKCVVMLPKGGVAKGKVSQALLHGAEVVEVDGVFDDALDRVFTDVVLSGRRTLYPLNSYNPWRLEGQKTIAFEVVEELGRVPDFLIVPVGNAGNISAIWKGFKELQSYGLIDRTPRMIGVQSEGAAPLVMTWVKHCESLQVVESPRTVATAIRIGKPVNWLKALKAVRESGGTLISVSDNELLESMKTLARVEGVGVEPAGAVTLAGYIRAIEEGLISEDDVVLVGTGHALKDPDTIIKHFT